MHLYEKIANQVEAQIGSGIYRPGERLPSVRESSRSLGVSVTSIFHAYGILEARGVIRAKPQSGYFVLPSEKRSAASGHRKEASDEAPDLEAIARRVLGATSSANETSFGTAYPDPSLFPTDRIMSLLRGSSRRRERGRLAASDPAGGLILRREIAKRYAHQGHDISADDIIITVGGINSINLSLSALFRPGDAIAVEDVAFFPASFSVRRFGLRAVPIPTTAERGLDLDALERVLDAGTVKGCLLMTTCHNPLGTTLPQASKARLIRMIEKHCVPLIENDAYGELVPPEQAHASIGTRRSDLLLHCSSLSNALSPDLKVGWVTAGRFRDRILSVKFLSDMSSSSIAQDTAARYLQQGTFDRHLRAMRTTLQERCLEGLAELEKWQHVIVRHSRPDAGFMVWVELLPGVDTLELYLKAAEHGIGFVPGALFSVDRIRSNEMALNFSGPWTESRKDALHCLMRMIEGYRT